MLIRNRIKEINIIIRPILYSSLFSKRYEFKVIRHLPRRWLKSNNFNLLFFGPKLIEQEAKRLQNVQVIIGCKNIYIYIRYHLTPRQLVLHQPDLWAHFLFVSFFLQPLALQIFFQKNKNDF